METLRVADIEKSFRGQTVVNKISFGVRQGEIMGLLGPNGAGKTTILRMIMGIIEQDRGSISFHGKGIENNRKRHIGYLPEERGLYEDAATGDVLEYLGNLKGMSRSLARGKARKWLQKMGLLDKEGMKISELSKGMAQKVQFIASVLHEPELVILDEPFAGLDPVNQDLFREIVRDLCASGSTILLSSHRMNMVEELCKRVFMIHEGREVLNGNLEQIKQDFGKDLVKMTYSGDGDLSSMPFSSYISNLEVDGKTVRFHLEKGYSPAKFIRELPEDIEIEELSISKPPLHDIFVARAKGGKDDQQ